MQTYPSFLHRSIITLISTFGFTITPFFKSHCRGICSSEKPDAHILPMIENVIIKLAKAYKEVYKRTSEPREFFGLRDYYRYTCTQL